MSRGSIAATITTSRSTRRSPAMGASRTSSPVRPWCRPRRPSIRSICGGRTATVTRSPMTRGVTAAMRSSTSTVTQRRSSSTPRPASRAPTARGRRSRPISSRGLSRPSTDTKKPLRMLVDLHAHYPMHLLTDEQQRTHERARNWWRQRWQGRVVDLISRFANYQGPGDTPSVDETLMREGDVGVALSVLYQPFDELDLTKSYGAPPQQSYFDDIVGQHRTIEDHVKAHSDKVAIAHTAAELDQLLRGDIPILIHAIEGGFALGGDRDEIRRNAATLAGLGIGYVTVAHLFFRDV